MQAPNKKSLPAFGGQGFYGGLLRITYGDSGGWLSLQYNPCPSDYGLFYSQDRASKLAFLAIKNPCPPAADKDFVEVSGGFEPPYAVLQTAA